MLDRQYKFELDCISDGKPIGSWTCILLDASRTKLAEAVIGFDGKVNTLVYTVATEPEVFEDTAPPIPDHLLKMWVKNPRLGMLAADKLACDAFARILTSKKPPL